MCTAIKPLIPESDQHLTSISISPLNQTLSYENKGNDNQLKNLLTGIYIDDARRDRSNYMRLQRCVGTLVHKWLCTVRSMKQFC